MEKEKWLKSIIEQIKEISDKDFQQRIWVKGEGPEVSSYTEVMCRLFDDYDLEGFLNVHSNDIPPVISSKLTHLKDSLNNYNVNKTDKEIVDDKEWDKIVNEAKDVIYNLP